MNKIIGHEIQRDFLTRYLMNKKNHHGFLFIGPESVGKKTIAKIFAHHIVYGKKNIVWDDIEGVQNGDIDIIVPIQEQKKNRIMTHDISIDQIITAKRSFALSPYNTHKVMIIDDAHKMTVSAQNALLKTLEEPQKDRCIILISHQPDALLDTITSRCITVRFGSVSADLFSEMTDDADTSIYQGRPGYMYRYSEDGDFRDIVNNARSTVQILNTMPVHERIKMAETIAKKDDQHIRIFLQVWIHHIHNNAHDDRKWHLLTLVEMIDDTMHKIETTNVNKQLALEELFINLT